MWLATILIAVAVLTVLVVLVFLLGKKRWQTETEVLRAQLAGVHTRTASPRLDFLELEGLPPPVQRYFRVALTDGQAMIAAVRVDQIGTFNMSESGQRWMPFTATQYVTCGRPGFIWDARVRMFPCVIVHVWDAYIAGCGVLTAKLLGLSSVMNVKPDRALAEGELMRYLGEAAWYPTALLPSQGVSWRAVDETSAKVTLYDGAVSVTALFRFGEDGLIKSFLMERGRLVAGTTVKTPWSGRYSDYQLRAGMQVPAAGEVEWLPENGQPHPYWRGQLAKIEYDFLEMEN